MLARIGIVCFASSYAIVLALEVSRLFLRSGIRGAMLVFWAVAGLTAQTIFLSHRVATSSGVPLSSWQDWFLVGSWFLMIVYLYWLYCYPRTYCGLFILPSAIGMIWIGWFAASPIPFAREPASKVWGVLHGALLSLTAVALLVGFASGLMYLWQDHRLKHKIATRGLQLPNLEWLRRSNARSIVAATILMAMGIATGILLNVINVRATRSHLPWDDPFITLSGVMFCWLLFCTIAGVFLRSAHQGKKIAYLTILSFVLLVVSLVAGYFSVTQHGGRRTAPPPSSKDIVVRFCIPQSPQATEMPDSPKTPNSRPFTPTTEA